MRQFDKWTKHRKEKIVEMAKKIYAEADINVEFDIPYLAGYSNDAKTIYFDRHLPRYVHYKDKEIDLYRYLKVHEATEKACMMLFNFGYESAHRIALEYERMAVEANDIPWQVYDKITNKFIKTAESEKIKKLPPDLDLTPYQCFQDTESKKLLSHMKKIMH